MHIIAFGASHSRHSINKQFATYAASRFKGASSEILDLTNYELPLFTVDLEREIGHPEAIQHFIDKVRSADLLIISLAEHNGSYTAAFKNLFDWVSRVKPKLFEDIPLFLLSTSPGGRGGLGVMEAARVRFPIHGAAIVGHYSLPKFGEHFDPQKGITDQGLRESFEEVLQKVMQALPY